MLEKKNRITQKWEFLRVKDEGETVKAPYFLMNFSENGLDYSRFGFIATAKLGGAVKRNRAVRVLREAVRLSLPQIATGYDFVFVLNSEAAAVKMQTIQQLLQEILSKKKVWRE